MGDNERDHGNKREKGRSGVMTREDKASLLRELFDLCDRLPVWTYDANGTLLGSDCAGEAVLNTAFSAFGCQAQMLAAAARGDLFTYVVPSFQLGVVTGSLVQCLTVFAVAQIPLAIAEGLLTVVVFNVLEKYSKTELQQLCVL